MITCFHVSGAAHTSVFVDAPPAGLLDDTNGFGFNIAQEAGFWPLFSLRLALFALKKQFVLNTPKMLSPFFAIDSPVRSPEKVSFFISCRFCPSPRSIRESFRAFCWGTPCPSVGGLGRASPAPTRHVRLRVDLEIHSRARFEARHLSTTRIG